MCYSCDANISPATVVAGLDTRVHAALWPFLLTRINFNPNTEK